MTELIRDACWIFLAWSIGLTITYGLVESTFPPFLGWRVAIASHGEPSWWGEVLVYCPICTGFWVHGFTAVLVDPLDPWSFVRGACLATVASLVVRAFAGVPLVDGDVAHEREADLRMLMRLERKKESS